MCSEHLIGPDEFVRLYNEEGVGFVVYKAEMTFKEGAAFPLTQVSTDVIEVRPTVEPSSDFRLVFQQDIYHQGRGTLMVQGLIHLVTIGPGELVCALTSCQPRLGATRMLRLLAFFASSLMK